MSFKSIVRELMEMEDGDSSISETGPKGKHWQNRNKSYVAPDVLISELNQQGQWDNLPPELLLDIIRRVEESEASWPARSIVVSCASVCKIWRDLTKEIVRTPEECGRLTFPISLKQPGPRESPIQCFVKRDGTTSIYCLYHALTPSEDGSHKLLLAAKRIRRATSTDFVISLSADDFSRASNAYVGRLRSNFLGTKFTIYDSQPPVDSQAYQTHPSRRFHAKQVSPRVSACNYSVASISYQLNVLRTRGPRRMQCVMHSVPVSSILEGGKAPTPLSFLAPAFEKRSSAPVDERKEAISDSGCLDQSSTPLAIQNRREPLVLRNKGPRWHEQLQCWCLNFKGRVTVASVKNFQLGADASASPGIPAAEVEKVILQFGKIGKDSFTMDYCYPLSAFQAFAICLSSFDTKPVCE